MTARLTSAMLVSALIRRAQAEGGNGTVVTKGDGAAGAILLICAERGTVTSLSERVLKPDGHYRWAESGPQSGDPPAVADYCARRRSRDPDLWIVELDVSEAERLAAETIGDC